MRLAEATSAVSGLSRRDPIAVMTTYLVTSMLGALVGFSLGLTGGGGAIFAVPLLVYALHVPPREAVGISLLTVGSTALVGLIQRAWIRMVDFPTGLVFAFAGMIGAPIGSRLAGLLPDSWLLTIFAGFMIFIALRMWLKSNDRLAHLPVIDRTNSTCQIEPSGRLQLTSRCALLLAVVGLAVGILTGLFGVGGGFIIVPSLITFAKMPIQRAIGTSLLVISLVSLSGSFSHSLTGHPLSLPTAALFTLGSLTGLLFGSLLSQRLAGPTLQRLFASAILMVALFVISQTLYA